MISLLEDNPLGVVLASLCGGLLLVLLVLVASWTLEPSGSSQGAADPGDQPSLDLPSLEAGEPLEAYAVITERPVFNESRLPVLEEDAEDDGEDDLLAEEDVEAPEMQLSGVVITPSIRMATLKPKGSKQSLVAFEGQPLKGDFGSWQVSRIGPREVTLSSGSGEELQLRLEVHDIKIEEPPKVETAKAEEPSAAATAGSEGERPLSRAEEIRQRIAQRREELRRAAEEQQSGESPESPENNKSRDNYRSTIQSMIRGTRQDEDNDENQK